MPSLYSRLDHILPGTCNADTKVLRQSAVGQSPEARTEATYHSHIDSMHTLRLIHSKPAKSFVFLRLSLDIIAYGFGGGSDGKREKLEGEGHDVDCDLGQRVARILVWTQGILEAVWRM